MEEKEIKLRESVTEKMMQIPNIIDDSVPIGKDDSENVELEKNLENLLFLILKFLITLKSWNV